MQHTIGTTRTVPIGELTTRGGNPRRGDIRAIADSLKANGQYRPVVANEQGGTLEVLAGNHTVAAAKELGWGELLVHVVQVDDEQARRIVLADNRTADLATYDLAVLAAELDALTDFSGTGYAEADLQAVLDVQEDAQEALHGAQDTYEGVYPYEGTRTLTLRLMEPLWEQWREHAAAFDSPEEALEHLLDHPGAVQ